MAGWVQGLTTIYSAYNSRKASDSISPVAETPTVPQVDEETLRQQERDRLRRRKGMLSNIYAGADPAAPTVGRKKLFAPSTEKLG